LQFSLRIQHGFVSSIIHIQYLFGLSVVQAIKKLPGCSQMPLHLKWPNDIYCKVDGITKKIGGILITSEYISESMSFNVTIGCGLNVLNSKPSMCLQDLTDTPICIEIVLAAILAEFQQLYDELIHQSNSTDPFGIFRERYYHCWLHT
jgi:biotin--protein ligase